MRTSWTEAVRDARLDPIWVVLAVFLIRLPSFGASEIDPDESMYMLVAREVLHGNLPYVTTFQEKPLGMPLATALALGLMGTSVTAMRMFGALAVSATGLLLRSICLRTGLSRIAAFASAIAYALTSTRLGGLATNTELLFAPLTAAAILQAVTRLSETAFIDRCRTILIIGVYIGLSIWFKYLAAIVGCVLFVVMLLTWHREAKIRFVEFLVFATCYAVACGMPTLLSAAFYIWAGHWEEFWDCNIGFMPRYVAVAEPWRYFVLRPAWGLFQLGILMALLRDGWHTARRTGLACWLLAAWLASEACAVVAPWKFYDHYFLVLLPPLCVIAGYAVEHYQISACALRRAMAGTVALLGAEVWLAIAPWRTYSFEATFLTPLFVLAMGLLAYRFLSCVRANAILASIGAILLGAFLRPTWMQAVQPDAPREIANFLRLDRQQDDRLWVVNAEPVIYILADFPIPTRYVFPHFLVSPFSIVTGVDTDAEISRILSTRPRYLAVKPANWSWTDPTTALIIKDTIAQRYSLAIEAATENGSVQLYILKR